MKSYRLVTVPYDPAKEKYFRVHDKCLMLTVVNSGLSNIIVDNLNEVLPNQAFSFAHIPGFYIKQDLRIQIINDANKALTTKVRIRMAIEN